MLSREYALVGAVLGFSIVVLRCRNQTLQGLQANQSFEDVDAGGFRVPKPETLIHPTS